jgi:hypothetical protein
MWEPRRLTTLWAFTACYRDSFTFHNIRNIVTYFSFGRQISLDSYEILVPKWILFWQLCRCFLGWDEERSRFRREFWNIGINVDERSPKSNILKREVKIQFQQLSVSVTELTKANWGIYCLSFIETWMRVFSLAVSLQNLKLNPLLWIVN